MASTMQTCVHCGRDLYTWRCEACAGAGYFWQSDGAGGYRAIDCDECGGSGRVSDCCNLDCPGKRWYPLTLAEADILTAAYQTLLVSGDAGGADGDE